MSQVRQSNNAVWSSGNRRLQSLTSWWRSCFLPCLLVLLTPWLHLNALVAAPADATLELRVKAAYIYNFCTFTKWPETAFKEDTDPLIIGIYGKDALNDHLASTIAGKTVQGHPLKLLQSDNWEDLKAAQVIYISDSQTAQWEKLSPTVKSSPILTVGNGSNFTRNGGIVAFYPDAGRIHFEINLTIANSSGLKLDSRLLQLARITKSGKDAKK